MAKYRGPKDPNRNFLILTRRMSEEIIVTTPSGERIAVMLVGWNGKQARIGIQASKDSTINRKEVQDEIDADNVANSEALFV